MSSTYDHLKTEEYREHSITNPLSADEFKASESSEEKSAESSGQFKSWAEWHSPATGHQLKEQFVLPETSEFAFIINIFRWNGTVLKDVYPQFLYVLFIVLFNTILITNDVYSFNMDNSDDSKTNQMFYLASTLVGFLLVFRSGQAYSNFADGRRLLGAMGNSMREIIQLTYTYPRHANVDRDRLMQLRIVLRRKLLQLHALCRQQIREANHGFTPGCAIEGLSFTENWHLDPCQPCIGRLMSKQEKETLHDIDSRHRPAFVQAELNMLGAEMSQHYIRDGHIFMDKFHRQTKLMMEHFEDAYRLTETKVPVPYTHLLYLSVFLMTTVYAVISSCSIASSADDNWSDKFEGASGWVGSTLLTLSYYGILEISAKLQDPFGHDDLDHDLEQFCIKADRECIVVARESKAGDDIDYMTGDTGKTPLHAMRRTWRSAPIPQNKQGGKRMLLEVEDGRLVQGGS